MAFPPGFLWGTATSSHQVEGDNRNNDWWEWEEQTGRIYAGQRSGEACDHYHRFLEDIEMMAALGLNAYRFSLEWSRLEPGPDQFSTPAIDHYGEMIAALKARGIEPVVTLHHFTIPRWLKEAGGFLNPEVVSLFDRYTKEVARALGKEVTYWVTINEPMVLATQGFLLGLWPPGHKNLAETLKVARHLLLAHGRSYRRLKEAHPGALVGLAKHYRIIDPLRSTSWLDRLSARLLDYIFNWAFTDSAERGRLKVPFGWGQGVNDLAGTQDFMGVNYYSRDMISFDLRSPTTLFARMRVREGSETNDLGWEVYPEGLYRLLMALKRYRKPILITENGISTGDDRQRERFLREHLHQVERALGDGADVRGYFYWSLLDNFEWAEGYRARFGLLEVDFATQERMPRPSARLYGRLAKGYGEGA
ncbi:MAG: glycoside hydrolase family 1 protein [Firmicutes bacterium]|nr:glycoside hydrolase family 1 protein [Bacillota bacterium]MCL5039395.1 glycoside hydrolase family 1 protein [Bacillota bacterium]